MRWRFKSKPPPYTHTHTNICSRHGELAPRPQTRAFPIQREHTDDTHDAQSGQCGDALVDAQVEEERPREQNAAARHGGTEEIVAREERGRVLWVRQRHVNEYALEYHEDGNGEHDYTDDAGDPRDIRSCGPSEDEQAGRREEGCDERGHETVFLRAKPVRHDIGHEVEVQICDVRQRSDPTGDEDASEDDADGAEGEVVEDRVDEREGFEEGVVDPIDEGGVKVYKSDGRVFDGYLQRFDDGGYDRFRGLDVLLVDLRLRA